MDENDEKRAAAHLDLYRPDGRFYDLSEENGVLTLQLRRSALWERTAFSTLILLLANAFLMVLMIVGGGVTGNSATQFFKIDRAWIFDKNVAKVRCDELEIADFSKIVGVRAWRRGSRFFIALKLRYGQTCKLGQFAFSRSERAWRQDAAQIAAFLGVPLEIPPV